LAGAKYSAARLLIVHPLNKRALDYYRKFGFRPLRGDSSALYLPLETIVDAL
jgi:ribosomal protein S18 acetylase RimI-like enzyme